VFIAKDLERGFVGEVANSSRSEEVLCDTRTERRSGLVATDMTLLYCYHIVKPRFGNFVLLVGGNAKAQQSAPKRKTHLHTSEGRAPRIVPSHSRGSI